MTKVNHQSHCELVEGKESIQNEGILSHLKRKHVSEIELVLFGQSPTIFASLTLISLFSVAFALVLGNRNVTWNQSLVYGFDSYLFNVLFVGSAYVCLALCMGEMSSALPFSGGIFGFVRAAAGPYFGYVTSWFEIAFVSTYVIIKVDQLMKIMVALKVMTKDFTPYAVVVFYTSSFIINVLGGKPLWGMVCIIGFAAFFLYLIYLGGAADASLSNGSLDYQKFCQTGMPLTMGNIMPGRSNINGFYQGLQFVPLLSDTLKNPRDQVPRALMICSVVFVFFSVFLSLSSCSQYPGIAKLTKSKYPLVYGFSNVFNVSLQDSIWFNVPGMYGVAFCLFYCGGKQIHAISKSGLLKSALSFTTPVLDTPYMSYLVSTVSGVVLNVYVFYYPEGYDELRNIAVLASHLVFFIAFLTFILFKFNYSSLTRSFTSPLGIWGAIYGLGNYFIGLVSIVFYSGNSYYSVYALICVFAFSSALFWLIIARNQSFSEEEKKLMFKAYLINANREKRMKILKRNKKGAQSSTNSKGASTSSKICSLFLYNLFTVSFVRC